ncbi:MAG TPA: hypothetical protein VIJ68_00955, partial [Candidatus Saccharimonadales bacterium]
ATDPAAAALPPTAKRSFKPLLIALIAILIVGVGSAAAYVGVVIPNKPANVLRTAFLNTIQEKQVSTTGTVDAGGFKATFSTAANTTAKAIDAKVNLTISGVTFPVEGRLIGHNFYFKVGDLTTIANLLSAYSPNASSIAQTLNTQVANKWIVVDSTIIDQEAPLKCALDINWGLTSADIQLLGNQYGQHPFSSIQSTSTDQVNGKAAEKFALSISNAELNSFGNGAINISIVKNLEKCSSDFKSGVTPSNDKRHTPLTVWVDKGSKRIVQVAFQDGSTGSATVKLSYTPVSITAPSNPEPVLQLISTLESASGGSTDLSQLFGGSTGATN